MGVSVAFGGRVVLTKLLRGAANVPVPRGATSGTFGLASRGFARVIFGPLRGGN